MKIKKALIVIFALMICCSSVICAFASEPETMIVTIQEITTAQTTTSAPNEENDINTDGSDVDVEYNYEEDGIIRGDTEPDTTRDDIAETEIYIEEEAATEEVTTAYEETTTVVANENKESRVTIYFKDLSVSAHVKIKNKSTKEEYEFDINSDNEWAYSEKLEPGTYEIVSIKPTSTQVKIKEIKDDANNEITEFMVKDAEGLQVINLYATQKASFGLLAFFKKNLFLDFCIILLIAMYVINAKGYRIPLLSNWVDNYRN